MTFPRHRHDLGGFLNLAGFTGEGAEIGSAHCGFARIIMSQWSGKRLHLVDSWKQYDGYREPTNNQSMLDEWKWNCEQYASEEPRIHLHCGFANDISKSFPDGALDFVYIDGNHAYGYVKDDLNTWYDKVRCGGLICGHDYYDDVTPPHFCEVKRAVDEWADKVGLPIHSGFECTSWYCLKP